MAERKYSIGIQTFHRIVNEGYVYVDKTDLAWRLEHYAVFTFLGTQCDRVDICECPAVTIAS